MLLFLGENEKIRAYNPTISEADAQRYVSGGAIWTDQTIPQVTLEDGQEMELYWQDGEIVIVEVEEEPSQLDEIQANTDYMVIMNV